MVITPMAMPAATDRSRLDHVDAVRGVAIILVVLGHVLRGLETKGLVPDGLFAPIDDRIYAFHMPLFFVLSGLFLERSITRMRPAAYLGSRVLRLLYPLLLWTYVFLLVKLAAGPFANRPAEWGDLLVSPIPGQWHFWFLWALFLAHVGLIVLRPLLLAPRLRDVALVLAFLGSLYLGQDSLLGDHLPWAKPAERSLQYILLGMLAARFIGVSVDGRSVPVLGLVVVFLIGVGLPSLQGSPVRVAGVMTLCLALLAVFQWLYQRAPQGIVANALVELGAASMAIFLMHTIFSAAVREALYAAGVTDFLTHLLLGTAGGLAGSLLVLRVAQRHGLTRALGF